MKDNGLSTMEKVLADFIIESGNEINSQPFSTNMGIDENSAFYTRPEFVVMATMKTVDGEILDCKLYPSQNLIYVNNKLVKQLKE